MKDSIKNPAPLVKASATKPSAKVNFKDASSAPSANTKMVPKKSGKSADPVIKDAAHRSFTTATGGARYGISVKMSGGVAPEAGETLANGRLFSSAVKRTSPNFTAGMDASY